MSGYSVSSVGYSEELLRGWLSVQRAGAAEYGGRTFSAKAFGSMVRSNPDGWQIQAFVAHTARGAPVGAALLQRRITDNETHGQFGLWGVPDVSPEVLRLVTGEVILRARGLGIKRLVADIERETRMFEQPDVMTLQSMGFQEAYALTEWRLHLSGFYPSTQLSVRLRDVSLETVVGRIPERCAASYVELENILIAEHSHGGLPFSRGGRSVEELRSSEDELEALGKRRVCGMATDAKGDVVGCCTCIVDSQQARVEQSGTVIRPDFRGLGLGRRLMEAALTAVKGEVENGVVVMRSPSTNESVRRIATEIGYAEEKVIARLVLEVMSDGPLVA